MNKDNAMLCVHPNVELYGSDRSFANAVAAFRRAFPDRSIDVLMPAEGPLLTLPPFSLMPVRTRELWILRRRHLLGQFTVGLPGNLARLFKALAEIKANSLTYINTIVVLDYILAARLARRPVVIHVREIPNGLEMRLFRALLIWSRATLIFNSEATRRAFNLPAGVATHVVYNGFADPGEASPSDYDGDRALELLLIGRINHWKGHETVISALAGFPEHMRRKVRCRIVGGVFEQQTDFLDRLTQQIGQAGLHDTVTISPFESDPTNRFRRADIVMVPSRLPEPFGRVAVEAMAHGRAVVASDHGGLTEIVVNGVTGWRHPPGNAAHIRAILALYIDRPESVRQHGNAGRQRFLDMFTLEATDSALMSIMADLTGSKSPA